MTQSTAYGLSIASEFALPELPTTERAPDVWIRSGSVDSPELDLDESGHGFAQDDGGWLYYFDRAGSFRIRDGREIVFERIQDGADSVLRLALLGPALGLTLIQRGALLLHASAVEVRHQAVAFLGGHGWGKSTMAALLHARGHTVVTDDVAALAADADGALQVLPSVPQFKLWPDALESLACSSEENSSILSPGIEKRGVRIGERFATSSRPLVRLYILGRGPAIRVSRVSNADALEALLPHWYGGRFGEVLLRAVGLPTVFRQCLELVERIPVRRLERPATDLSDASVRDDLERAVVEDLDST